MHSLTARFCAQSDFTLWLSVALFVAVIPAGKYGLALSINVIAAWYLHRSTYTLSQLRQTGKEKENENCARTT